MKFFTDQSPPQKKIFGTKHGRYRAAALVIDDNRRRWA